MSEKNLINTITNNGWSIGFALVAGYIIYKILKRKRNLPPGPTGYPFFGVMFEMKHIFDGRLYFHKLAQKYGDIVSCYVGSNLMVVLNNYDTTREAFLKRGEEFGDIDLSGVAFTNFQDALFTAPFDSKWKEMKKFAVQALKNSGFGTPRGEEKILNEVAEFVKFLENQNASAFETKTVLDNLTGNALISILLNKRYTWGSDDLKRLTQITEQFLNSLTESNELAFINQFIPAFLMKIIFRNKVKECERKADGLRKLISEEINDHRATFDPNSTRDFVDTYLREGKDKTMPEITFVNTISIFFPDGVGTTADAINWAILFLTYHPEYQKMAQKQIEEVCGSRPPTLADRKELKITEAIMAESFRLGSPAPLTTPHRAVKDTTLRGYNIPRDNTTIMANLYSCNMDPKIFPEPEKFNPLRFIAKDGKLINVDRVIPFGIGTRSCVGQQYVKCIFFLTLSHLLQRFTLAFPTHQPNPTLVPDNYIITRPQPYKVCAFRR